MTKEEAIEVLELIEEDIDCDGCRYFPDKEHCECVEECLYTTALKVAIKTLEQEPKTGHWILKRTFPTKLYDEHLNEYKCSECYREIRCTESQLVNYPYCHCGAKMIDEQKSEVEK